MTVFIILGALALLALTVVPGMPWFRSNELKWLDPDQLAAFVEEHGVKESGEKSRKK